MGQAGPPWDRKKQVLIVMKRSFPISKTVAKAPAPAPAQTTQVPPKVHSEEDDSVAPPKKKARTELPRGPPLPAKIWLTMSHEHLDKTIARACEEAGTHHDYVMFTGEELEQFQHILDTLPVSGHAPFFIVGTDFRGFLKKTKSDPWQFMEFPKRKLERAIKWRNFIQTNKKNATVIPWDAPTIRDIRLKSTPVPAVNNE